MLLFFCCASLLNSIFFKEHYILVLKHNLHVHLWKGTIQQFVIVSVANDGSSQNFHSSDLLKHFDIFAGESLFYILLYKSNLSFLKYQGLMLNENFQIRRILFKFKDHNYTFYQMSTSNFEFCFLFPTIFSFIFSTNLHLFFMPAIFITVERMASSVTPSKQIL